MMKMKKIDVAAIEKAVPGEERILSE